MPFCFFNSYAPSYAPVLVSMIELAARHGYDRNGNSLPESDEEYSEEHDKRTESDYRDGHHETAAGPESSESRPETSSYSGASFGGFGEGAKIPSRPRRSHLGRHRGVSFEQMERVFEALVRIKYCIYPFHWK